MIFKILTCDVKAQMIVFALFIHLGVCSIRKSVFYSSLPSVRLKSFGFEENGTFTINISTPNKTSMILFLLKKEIKQHRFASDTISKSICDYYHHSQNNSIDNFTHLLNFNSTFQENVNFLSWSGQIIDHAIYYPYLVACSNSTTVYKVSTDFQNPQSHIDFRDNYYSLAYLIVSFVYIICTIFWLINTIFYSKFAIPLHTAFAFISSTKAILSVMYSTLWEERRLGIVTYNFHGPDLYNIMYLFHFTLFFSVPLLAMSGWCIFREKIPILEIMKIVVVNFMFIVGFWKIRFIMSIKDVMFAMVFISVGFLSFLRNITDYILILDRIENLIPNGQTQLSLKMNLVTSFSSTTVVFGIVFALIYSLSVSMNVWNVVGDILMEFGCFLYQLIEMYFFMVTPKYEGENIFIDEKGELSCKQTIYLLQEPAKTDLAIASIEI